MTVRLSFLVLAALCCPSLALGQVERAASERVRLLNKDAMTAYEALEFDKAKAALEKALAEAKKYNIDSTKIAADTHLNLGIVWGTGFSNREMAIQHFTKALCIKSGLKLDPMLATPDMEELFNNAQENAKTHCQKKLNTKFEHSPVEAAHEGKAVKVWAKVGAGLKAHQVILSFRVSGAARFMRVAMNPTKPGIYLGIIDGPRVKPTSIHYYLEAQDDAGERLKGHGSGASPNIIRVIPDQNRKPPPPPEKKKMVSIGIMVGTGGGFVYGGETENIKANIEPDGGEGKSGPGIAFSPFHIAPEINYHINHNWHIGILGRIQVVNAITKNMGWASRVSVAGVLRSKRYFNWDKLKLFLGFGAGGGQIRHRIPVDDQHDTRIAQFIAFNIGGGINYMFTDMVGATFETDMLIMVPDFAAHLDFNAGLILCF